MRTIKVLPYNPNWINEYNKIKEELDKAIGSDIIAIEHVGSTSVIGLWAKPIIDIDIIIEKFKLPMIIAKLESVGYQHKGDLGIFGREAFDYNKEAKAHLMEHHLYICDKNNLELKQHLAFRDFLRTNEEYRNKYSEIKKKMALKYPHNIDKYIKGKEPVINDILKQCGIIPWQSNVKQEYCAMAIVLCKDKILITKELINGNIYVSLPKGHVEKNESYIKTAIRECYEETGVLLKPSNHLLSLKSFSYMFSRNNIDIINKTIHPEVFITIEENKVNIIEKNIVYAGFVKINDFIDNCSYDSIKKIVKEAIDRIENNNE